MKRKSTSKEKLKKKKKNSPLKEKQDQVLHSVELGPQAVLEAVLVEEQHVWLLELDRL